MTDFDVIIIGAGAAGLMCAIESGKRSRRTLLLDHSSVVGEKIRISGGGRCNFTNIHTSPTNFLSANKKFCISALAKFTPNDFIKMAEKYGIKYHEKTLGQLFCDKSSKEIIDMLLQECELAQVEIRLDTAIQKVGKNGKIFEIVTNNGKLSSESLVIATGGLSIPKIGATGFGYDIAKQFGLRVIEPEAALVPFTVNAERLKKDLAGVAVDVAVSCNKAVFKEAMLFTHKGLSGPAILQISSYWNEGDKVVINMAPDQDMLEELKLQKLHNPKQEIHNILANYLPKRLAQFISDATEVAGKMADLSNNKLQKVAEMVNSWVIIPDGTEGFRTAEVTRGGVDTDELSSSNLMAKKVEGLYFIGEVVDVTGHLGGFNFQWAWASGYAAGLNC